MRHSVSALFGSSLAVGVLAAASTVDVGLKAVFAVVTPLLTGEQAGAALGRLVDRLRDYPPSWCFRNVDSYEDLGGLCGAVVGLLAGAILAISVLS
jgi:hypothetical protein